jgi:hypothetical protein
MADRKQGKDAPPTKRPSSGKTSSISRQRGGKQAVTKPEKPKK